MRLHLLPERCRGLRGWRRIVEAGERAIAFALLGRAEVEVQVPGADDAVPATGVAVAGCGSAAADEAGGGGG